MLMTLYLYLYKFSSIDRSYFVTFKKIITEDTWNINENFFFQPKVGLQLQFSILTHFFLSSLKVLTLASHLICPI